MPVTSLPHSSDQGRAAAAASAAPAAKISMEPCTPRRSPSQPESAEPSASAPKKHIW